MPKRIIGCDVDGVLADFNQAYIKRLTKVTGRNLCEGISDVNGPPVWDWPKHVGYTDEEDSAAWASVLADASFWLNLGVLPEAGRFLELLQSSPDDDIYFITSRYGLNAKLQTEQWLELAGFGFPTVLIAGGSGQKGMCAAGLQLTHFIDDKASNCRMVKRASPETQVFLLSRAYNQAEQPALMEAGVVVLESLMQFIDVLVHQNDRE